MKKTPYLFLLLLLTVSCTAQPQPTNDVGAMVSATLTALPQQKGDQQANQPSISQATETPQTQPVSDSVQPTVQLVVEPTGTNTTPGKDNVPSIGTIVGKLSYPSSFIPPMRVAFFNITGGSVSYIDTAPNQGTFSVDLPEGKYHIVAYPYDHTNPPANTENVFAGGYTAAVPCGLSVDCADHSLLEVTVVAAQTVIADPGDWYAPQGAFPPMPNP